VSHTKSNVAILQQDASTTCLHSFIYLFRYIDTLGSTKLKTWPLNKTHQAQTTSSYGGLQKYTKYTKQSGYKTHNKSTSKTLKKSGKVDIEDWALEKGEGTKINNVVEKVRVLCIYDKAVLSGFVDSRIFGWFCLMNLIINFLAYGILT